MRSYKICGNRRKKHTVSASLFRPFFDFILNIFLREDMRLFCSFFILQMSNTPARRCSEFNCICRSQMHLYVQADYILRFQYAKLDSELTSIKKRAVIWNYRLNMLVIEHFFSKARSNLIFYIKRVISLLRRFPGEAARLAARSTSRIAREMLAYISASIRKQQEQVCRLWACWITCK